jgi:hypothetical protein
MTTFERLTLEALRNVSFGMGGARSFVLRLLAADDRELTDRQRWYVWHLAWKYRRQVPREVSDLALEMGAGSPYPQPAIRQGAKPERARALHKPTKYETMRASLERPLVFGDLEQARANRELAKRWALIPMLKEKYNRVAKRK